MTEATKTPKRALFVSLRVKLIIAFTLLFSVVFAASYYWFYTSSIDRALARVTEDLDVILNGAAAKIDGDAFATLAAEGIPTEGGYYPDNPAYLQHVEWLATVKHIFTDPVNPDEPRATLYTFIAGPGDHAITFIGSSSATANPPSGAKFFEVCTDAPHDCGDLTPNLQAISSGQLVNQTQIYSDKFGDWISGYLPVRNSNGEVVGALGVDFRADYVQQVRTAILNTVGIAFVLTYAFLFATVWLISRTFSEPIIKLTRIAARIGEGDYDQDFSKVHVPVRDEIDSLADVFEIMIGKVAKREEKLKQQVADLQIQIDHSKRDEQVKEIVDNDFFQTLQTKAYEMRSRRSQQEEESK